jgi:hypothetical protein
MLPLSSLWSVLRGRADGPEAPELTAIAFAAKRHWGYPEAWIDLWTDELTVDGRYVEENWVFLARTGFRTLGVVRAFRSTAGELGP